MSVKAQYLVSLSFIWLTFLFIVTQGRDRLRHTVWRHTTSDGVIQGAVSVLQMTRLRGQSSGVCWLAPDCVLSLWRRCDSVQSDWMLIALCVLLHLWPSSTLQFVSTAISPASFLIWCLSSTWAWSLKGPWQVIDKAAGFHRRASTSCCGPWMALNSDKRDRSAWMRSLPTLKKSEDRVIFTYHALISHVKVWNLQQRLQIGCLLPDHWGTEHIEGRRDTMMKSRSLPHPPEVLTIPEKGFSHTQLY